MLSKDSRFLRDRHCFSYFPQKLIAVVLLGILCGSSLMSIARLQGINDNNSVGEKQVTSEETPHTASWGYTPVATFPSRPIAITDLDADGNQELWTFDNVTHQYKVYESTAPDTFSLIYTGDLFPNDIEAGNFNDLPTLDWNNDGHRDYVGASTNFTTSNYFVVFSGNGSNNGIVPTYDTQSDMYNIPDQMVGLDFDNDGRTEFITNTRGGDCVIYEDSGENYIMYTGTLASSPAIDLATCGDFDKDGIKDFFTGGSPTDPTIRMWECSGNNAFTQVWSLNTGTQGCSLGIGDSDKDGANELYVNDAYSNNISVFECTGDNSLTFRTQFASPGGSGCFNVVDTDGNGKNEIIFEANSSPGYKQIRDYEATADNTWVLKWSSDPIPGVPGNVFATDIDNDRFCELITNSWNNTLIYKCNVANGTYNPPIVRSIAINGGAADTKYPNVTLTLDATGATEMTFSNDNVTYSNWESYSTTKTMWNLTDTATAGIRKVYFRARNATGTSYAVYNSINYLAIPIAPGLLPFIPNTTILKRVWLNWTESPLATNYSVYRSLSPISDVSGLTPIVNISAPATSYLDYGVISGNIYYYVVTARNAQGVSDPSACQSINVTIPNLFQNLFLLLAKVDPLTQEIISKGLNFIADVTGSNVVGFLTSSGDVVISRTFKLGQMAADMGLNLEFTISLKAHLNTPQNRVEFTFSANINSAFDLSKLKFEKPFDLIDKMFKVMDKMGVSLSAKLVATLSIQFYFDASDSSFGLMNICVRINPSIEATVELIPLVLNLKPEIKQVVDYIQKPIGKYLDYDIYNVIVTKIELGVNFVAQYDAVQGKFIADAQLVLNIRAELDIIQKSKLKNPEVALRLEGLVGVHFDSGASPRLSLCGTLTFFARINTDEFGMLKYVLNTALNLLHFSPNKDNAYPLLTLGSGCTGLVVCPAAAADEPDNDSDYLSDAQEALLGTNASNPDTDHDGLWDFLEVQLGTNPLSADSDNDGISDGDEYYVYHTNPLSNDTDGDGIPDGQEIFNYGTDPCSNDTDGDGLSDYQEIFVYHTLPYNYDTDSDGYGDGLEVLWYGTDPLNVASVPTDTDGDGLLDKDETDIYHTSPTVSNAGDTDGDHLSNIQEMIIGSNPDSPDTDNDGLSDYAEYVIYHTCFDNPDSDGDGYTDLEEINAGTDPLDAASHPLMPFWLFVVSTSVVGAMCIASAVRLSQMNRKRQTRNPPTVTPSGAKSSKDKSSKGNASKKK